jgi:hypothetical protein
MTNSPGRPDFTSLENASAQPSRSHSGSAFRRASHGVEATAGWLGDRVADAGSWLAALVRYLPVRVARLFMTLAAGFLALAEFGPSTVKVLRTEPARTRPFVTGCARRGCMWSLQFVLGLADLIGAPEIFAFLWRMLTHTSPLTGAEIAAAGSVLGPYALRYQDIRVAEGGVLEWIFAWNGQRAFATFHTLNLPRQGRHQRNNIDIVVHEIIHVYQYERAGSRYFAEALIAQREGGYDYGGPDALRSALKQGKRLRNYNREQQAQIAQDYYAGMRSRADLTAYEPFIRQLREGLL